jgi:Abnormal spindle-like microcephaly-assoc'd, ASPM-SPD-2-Hydin/Beta-propeller repeat
VEARPNRNLWVLAVCLSSTLLVAAPSAKLLSRHRTTARSEASQRQARLSVSALGPRLSKSKHPSSDQNLLFDPVLVYSTYLGGPSTAEYSFPDAQAATVVQTDASGNLYIAGYSNSPSFPVTTGALVSTNSARNGLGILVKLDPTGQTLLFSTYINGITVSAMAIDPNGDIYLAGAAAPSNSTYPPLPIPSGSTPYVSTPKNIGILKLNPTATTVLAATYLGGSGGDGVTGLALKPGTTGSNLYVTGTTRSNDFPTTQSQAPVLQSTLQSSFNAFVTVLNPTLSSAIYSTYLGQTSSVTMSSGPHTIAVDTVGDAYVVGTANPGFPTVTGALEATCPDNCGFIAELNPTGAALVHSTYFGNGATSVNAVAVDAAQNAYVEGLTNLSTSIPTMNPVSGFYACSTPNGISGFISEISAAGSLAFSSCVTGPNSTIFLDGSGNIAITGFASNGFPLHNPIQTSASTASAAPNAGSYAATVNPTNGSLVFSSFLGDGQSTGLGYTGATLGSPTLNDIAIDTSGNLYGAGFGFTFPVFNALQPVASPADPGSQCANPCVLGSSVAILKIAPTNAPAAALEPAVLTFSAQALGAQSTAQTVNVINLGSSSLTVSNVSATGDFAVQDGCTATVAAAGGTCALQVTFTPTATGNRTGSLSITDTSAGSPHTVQLTGVGGQASVTLSPTTLSFSQAVNTTGTSQVTLDNSGTLPLQISSVQISGTGFSEANACGISVPAGQSCVINVNFSPTALGNSTGTLTVTDSAAGSPQTVNLTGKGVAASLGLAYALQGGSSAPTAATVQAGTGATTLVQVGGAGLAGSVTLSCSGLPQGATCDFNPSTVQMFAGAPTQSLLVIQTTARSLLFMPIVLTTGLTLLALCLSILYFGRTAVVRAPRLRWQLVPLFALAICACGGGNGSSPSGGGSTSTGTPAGSHIITITATSGSSSQTLLFNLTVQ